jgi:hypothetical protein
MALLTGLLRKTAALACGAALAACATAPVDELLASTAIVAELDRETGALVETVRFAEGRVGEPPPGWGRFIVSPFATKSEYRLVEGNPGLVLEGRADGSASGFYRRIRIDPVRHPVIEWRWRVLQTPAEVDPRVPARDDSPARVIIAFHGDLKRLDFGEKLALRLYKALTGEKMPYAIIMYSWSNGAPIGTVVGNDETRKIQTIIVENGGGRIGDWREFRRNVLEDYRMVFGEEPWDIVGVGVMTDARNTGEKARAQYGEISFRAR